MPTRVQSLILLCVLTASCNDGCTPRRVQAPPPAPASPALRIIALTDLDGYLEPCGCQSRPLGGIDRAAARIRELGSDRIPSVVVAAGNLFYGTQGAHAAAAPAGADHAPAQAQWDWQAETMAQALAKLGLAAAVPGPADRAQTPDTLRRLASLVRAPLLCTEARAAGVPDCQSSVLLERAGVRVGVFGLDQQPSVGESGAAAARLTAELRARGAQLVIGLVDGEARTARRIAGATPGLDFLLHGGAQRAEVPTPERIGDATLLRAGNQGHGLLVLDLFHPDAAGRFEDDSEWTRRDARAAHQRRVDELTARIAEWKRDPHVDRAQLAVQEQRLSALRAQSAAPAAATARKRFAARFVELDESVPPDPELRALLRGHDRRVNEHNRRAFANLQSEPVPAGMPGFVGSERCGGCHETALQWWTQHPHGRAYATLERVEKQFNLSCVGCHVTGYGKPGGASVVQNAGLTNVGCESCHGPGSLHAADPDVDTLKNVRRDAPESVCVSCHDSEHSDRFEYTSYRQRLLVPGHGKPATAR